MRTRARSAGSDPRERAEELWMEVLGATRALSELVLGRDSPPEGETWRAFVARALRAAGFGGDEAEELASVFVEVRDRLHGAVFCGGLYEEREHGPVFEKGIRYVETVMGAISKLPRRARPPEQE